MNTWNDYEHLAWLYKVATKHLRSLTEANNWPPELVGFAISNLRIQKCRENRLIKKFFSDLNKYACSSYVLCKAVGTASTLIASPVILNQVVDLNCANSGEFCNAVVTAATRHRH